MPYSVVLTREPEGGFTVTIPCFPEYLDCAADEEEALTLARQGIAREIARLKEEGKDPPVEPGRPRVWVVEP